MGERQKICTHMNINIFKNSEDVANGFIDWFVPFSQSSQPLHIALSGGSTPAILFRLFAAQYHDQINWANLHFYWGDERCVPPTDEQSNYKMAKELFMDQVGVPDQNIHRIKGEMVPAEEAVRYAEEIRQWVPTANGLPTFDLIMLGMGGDGHTASIFPHQMELLNSKALCEVATHPESGQHRVSFTGRLINNANQIAFLVTGESKKEKVRSIITGAEDSRLYPAFHVQPTHGQLQWYLDEAAAAGIGK
jgi:6-phosphogluconolactonase